MNSTIEQTLVALTAERARIDAAITALTVLTVPAEPSAAPKARRSYKRRHASVHVLAARRGAKTRAQNGDPLRVVIPVVLRGTGELTARELARAVKATGYVSRSRKFHEVVGVACNGLVHQNVLVRTDRGWKLSG